VFRSHGLRHAAGVFVVAAVCCGFPHAVANKISADAGRGTFQNVGGFIRAIFKDSGHQDSVFMFVTALVALMFLAGIVTIGLGALQAVRGDRGGSDTIIGGAYGLVAILVMLAVIL
jgi:hypothetical protein